ncbi:hypothetical protein JOC78_002784 [Bacillus ectoiniformans]|nr:hypothetical protein [Bacillus ectoiniformans]
MAIYEGPPFLKVETFMNALQIAPFPLGRLIDVLKMKLEDPAYEKLLIRGE